MERRGINLAVSLPQYGARDLREQLPSPSGAPSGWQSEDRFRFDDDAGRAPEFSPLIVSFSGSFLSEEEKDGNDFECLVQV